MGTGLRFLLALTFKVPVWNLDSWHPFCTSSTYPNHTTQHVITLRTKLRSVFLRKQCEIVNNNDNNSRICFPQLLVITNVPWTVRVKRRGKACRTQYHKAQPSATWPTSSLIYASPIMWLPRTDESLPASTLFYIYSLIQDSSLHLLDTQSLSYPGRGQKEKIWSSALKLFRA